MQVDNNIKDQVPFCSSKGLYKDELQERISQKTQQILAELSQNSNTFQELRVSPGTLQSF